MTEDHKSDRRAIFIIVSWNRSALLRKCLLSLKQNLCISHHIVVVDNASSDGAPEMIAQNFPEVHLVKNQTNRGFGRAVNQGLREIRNLGMQSDYVVFLNNDTILPDNSLEALLRFLDSHEETAAAVPAVHLSEGGCQTGVGGSELTLKSAFNYFSGLSVLFPRRFRGLFLHQPFFIKKNLIPEIQWASGVCLITKRHLWEKITGFPEDSFMYAEDLSVCRQIRSLGKIVYFPSARIVHFSGEEKSEWAGTLWLDSLFNYYQKISPEPKKLRLALLKCIFVLGFWGRMVFYRAGRLFLGRDVRTKFRDLRTYSGHILKGKKTGQ